MLCGAILNFVCKLQCYCNPTKPRAEYGQQPKVKSHANPKPQAQNQKPKNQKNKNPKSSGHADV